MQASDLKRKNLEKLGRRFPEEAERVGAASADRLQLQVEPGRRGLPTLKVTATGAGPPGKYLHSRFDPEAEAEERARALDLDAGSVPILLGAGLGYLALAVARLTPRDRPLILIEPEPAILAAAFEVMDWSPVLDRERLLIVTQLDDLARQLADELPVTHRVEPLLVPIAAAAAEIYGAEAVDRIRAAVVQAFRTGRLQHETLKKMGRWFSFNVLDNLGAILARPGVAGLENRWRGRPAVIAAPGPSAAELIPRLKGLDGVMIIAVDTALKPLLAAGVAPHAVVTVDPQPANAAKFHGLGPVPAALVFGFEAVPGVVSGWAGPRIVYGRPGPAADFFKPLEGKGFLGGASTISSDAFSLAMHLGAEPIYLVGLDLGFPDGRQYAPGTWAQEVGLDPPKADLTVPGVHGGPIPTWQAFADQIDWMARRIRQWPGTVINTSGSGALIPGAEPGGLPGAEPGGPDPAAALAVEPAEADAAIRARTLQLVEAETRDLGRLEWRLRKLAAGNPNSEGFKSEADELTASLNAKTYLSDAMVAEFADAAGTSLKDRLETLRLLVARAADSMRKTLDSGAEIDF